MNGESVDQACARLRYIGQIGQNKGIQAKFAPILASHGGGGGSLKAFLDWRRSERTDALGRGVREAKLLCERKG